DVDRLTHQAGVRLSSPVMFSTENASDTHETSNAKATGKKKVQKDVVTSYSSLGVHFSVSGTYSKLRQFINQFERSDQFVIIDSIALGTGDSEPGEQVTK